MQPPEKKWYQKKRYVLGLFVLGAIALASNSTPTPSSPTAPSSVEGYSSQSEDANVLSAEAIKPDDTSNKNDDLSNTNYYTNSDDQEIHSPAYSENNAAPDGASAECRDGTYSFSAHRSGTCSHHGGVDTWLD